MPFVIAPEIGYATISSCCEPLPEESVVAVNAGRAAQSQLAVQSEDNRRHSTFSMRIDDSIEILSVSAAQVRMRNHIDVPGHSLPSWLALTSWIWQWLFLSILCQYFSDSASNTKRWASFESVFLFEAIVPESERLSDSNNFRQYRHFVRVSEGFLQALAFFMTDNSRSILRSVSSIFTFFHI